MQRTILVVDDDPHIVDILAELLTDEGYAVRRAHDGQAALDEIRRESPALIVTDVMMPKLDGVSLTKHLRDREDPTPVVLMSAVYAGIDLPGVDFVPKPFDLEYIVKVVNRVFRRIAVEGNGRDEPAW